ncbi:hypothetical protein PRIPAC_97046 [Pristionchus pacificus]|uniref:Ribosomal protein n=1 Tax=Pristionchus pacificus TaxID=54126 RepID=A0A2A6BCW2_PRIPA|nr:hypothetical protein PRIPAC_97046 [Pristionchus pacificus]|eukprot:PDM63686.1 ribosomal protein [Pristionchus pacificus]
MVRGSAGALMVVGIYSEIMDGCEGLGPAQWILAYERGEVKVPEWSDLVKLGVTKDMAPLRQFFRKRHPQGSQVEALKWVDKSENGKGRILSKQGRKDLDRIAADLRSTAAPAEL